VKVILDTNVLVSGIFFSGGTFEPLSILPIPHEAERGNGTVAEMNA